MFGLKLGADAATVGRLIEYCRMCAKASSIEYVIETLASLEKVRLLSEDPSNFVFCMTDFPEFWVYVKVEDNGLSFQLRGQYDYEGLCVFNVVDEDETYTTIVDVRGIGRKAEKLQVKLVSVCNIPMLDLD